MPRNITVTLADGTKHVYRNAPDNVTPAAVQARAQKEFGLSVTALDGGRSAPAPGSADAFAQRWANVPPTAAKALVQRFAAAAARQGTPMADFAARPDVAGLMRVAGMKSIAAPLTRDQQIQAKANKAVAAEGGSPLVNAVSAGIRGSTFGLADRAVAGVRSLTSGGSYSDNLDYARAERNAEAAQSGTGNVIGNILGAVATGGPIAKGIGLVGRLAAGASPTIAAVGSVAGIAARAAPRTAAIAKTLAAGAGGGAAQAAGDGQDIGTGAAEGAAGALALHGAAKVAMPILQRAGDFLGTSSAASVLRRYTSETAESLQTKLADFRARTGTEPTVFELLNTGDRQSLRKAVGLMPDASRERLATNVRTRAAAIGTDQTARTAAIVADAQNTRAANIAQQLADSRSTAAGRANGVTPPVTPEDQALAASAVRSPLDMDTVRRTVNSNIMAPHENTRLYDNVSDLYPQYPELQPDGSVHIVESHPEISRIINSAAGLARLKQDGLTGSDITDMLSKLRKTSIKGGIEGGAADDAIAHITGLVDQDHPVVGEAMANMAAANAANHRIIEGMTEGAATRVRENAPVTRAVRNAYDTPEGADGRAMGQAAEIERRVSGTPQQALRATTEIGTSPGEQAAISANLGDAAGARIAASAAGVSESARRLAGLSTEAQDATHDPVSMLHGLMALSPATLPHTKVLALARLARGGVGLPENASNGIVDALFSQNPTQIARAMAMLNNAGDAGRAALRDIGRGVVTGAATAGLSEDPSANDLASSPAQAVPDIAQETAVPAAEPAPEPVSPTPPDNAATDDSGPGIDVGEGEPVAAAQSPYLAHLQNMYANENPDLLDLSDRIQHQESGGHQHGKDGLPIISKAGAIGTMQIMPGTAVDAARAAGLPLDLAALHNDPVYNKALGIAHLATLLKHYGGDVTKSVAAYNAGAGRVDHALAHGGTNWLAALPAETRDYVGKVS